MGCLNSLRDGIRSIPASLAHLGLYVGIKATDADLGLNGTNLWIYPSFDHDANVARFANDIDSPFAGLFISFPSAKDPDFTNRHPGRSTVEVVTFVPFESVEAGATQMEASRRCLRLVETEPCRKAPGSAGAAHARRCRKD